MIEKQYNLLLDLIEKKNYEVTVMYNQKAFLNVEHLRCFIIQLLSILPKFGSV